MLETKQVLVHETDYINDLTAFGWQKTQVVDERSGRCTNRYQILARDSSMINYANLARLEYEYEGYRKKLEFYDGVDYDIMWICFLILIIPGIVYLVYKGSQKKRIRENNEYLHNKMQALVVEAKKFR